MEKKVIVVCSVVGFLGLLSAVTGFAAEAKRIKSILFVLVCVVYYPVEVLDTGSYKYDRWFQGSQVQFTGPTCVYPSSPALGLGLTAAVALMVAQIIINVTTGCMCCKRGAHQSNSNWTLALVCFVVSWFTFVIAFLLLLTGAALNDQHGEETMYFGNYYCYVVKPGVFAGAAVLSLASVILGIAYYLALSSVKNSDPLWRGPPPPNQGSIAMGQPCPPPNAQAQAPVFVHEDTYMRRQFT